MEATVAQALLTAAMLLIFGGFLVWAVRTRQFHDVEEPNVRLFAEDGQQDAQDGEDTHACATTESTHEEDAR